MHPADYQTFAHQEEKQFSNFSSSHSSAGRSYSKAYSGFVQSLKGGGSIHGDHSGGEDEEKYVFNFPGPGDLPLSPSTAEGGGDSSRRTSLDKDRAPSYGTNVAPNYVTYSEDGSLKSKRGSGPKKASSATSGSHLAEESHGYKKPGQKGYAAKNPHSNIIISSSSDVGSGNWTLSPFETQKKSVFAPQRSSTMLNKHAGNKSSTTATVVSTEFSSAKVSKSSRSYVTSSGGGDRIVYERYPVSEEEHSKVGHQKSLTRYADGSDRSKSPHQDGSYGREHQILGKHVSTFNVSDNDRSLVGAVNVKGAMKSQPAKPSQTSHFQSSHSKPSGEKGEYTIEVKFADQDISGSPFTTKAFDMRKLVVSEMPSTAARDHHAHFNIDASQAGPGNIEIRVNEGRVPCTVENKGNHRFTASFLPENSRPHSVEICFNNEHVIGSPWTVLIVDPHAISLRGKDRLQCHKKATVHVLSNGQKVHEKDLDVKIKGPKGESVPHQLTHEDTDDAVVKYTPTHVGEYTIYVKYCDQHVTGSPFMAKAYNLGAIYVTPLHDGFVNQPMYFTIDVGEAGEGQLQIMVNNGDIPNEVEPEAAGKYKIKFIPAEPGKQVVDILFNDQHLSCSPLTCIAQDLSASVVGLHQLIPVKQESSFHIQSQASLANLATEIIITGPSGQNIPARVTHLPDGKGLNVEYVPRDIGIHSVKATLAGLPIKGSPFSVRTFDPNLVKITRVKQGIVGVPCKFNVDASEAGDGTLEITINHNGQNIPNNALTVGKNKYECSFIGQQPGSYKVNVLYNDLHVQGSPYSVSVVDVGGIRLTGDHWNLVSCNKKAGFNVVSPHGSFEEMTARIIAPDGSNVPCRLGDRGDGTAKIDWHPNMIGAHKVYIDYAGVPIQGSPFTIKVFDASRVRVSNINPGFVNRPVSFNLDASEAGDGNLEILVMCDDEIVPNYVQDEGNTMFKVTFTPKRAGPHLIHTQFNGEAVKGSPHQCPVLDPESVQVSGKGVEMAAANLPTSFHVNMKHAGDARLNVRVVSPYGEEVPVHVSGNSKSGLRIDYTPLEVGLFKVFVECAGSPVKGSPFTCNVFDPALVRINAPGRAYFGKPMHFHLDTSAAGQGKLNFQIKCRGSEVPCRLREVGQDRFDVSFTPQNIAPHLITAFFNDMQVPGTPFEVTVIDSTSVSLSGDGVRLAKVYKEAGLSLDHQGLDERDLDVKIIAPSGNTIPARLNNSGTNLRLNFTPLEVGAHKVHVSVGDTPVSGSPFTCHVYDPSAVRIIDVDKSPQKEREIGFTIDSSAAGNGTLEVLISHKGQPVHAECRKVTDGQYHYTFKPLNIGRYEVKATFNGDTIPGSPLIIEVEEDRPTFIRINFSSVEPINAKGRNHFLLHTSGRKVDREMLDVMILAPNGENIPARLLQQQDGDYKVEWTPSKPGRHSVDVMYGGQQIQGSPFHIDVFDIHKIRVNNFFHGDINERAGFKLDCTQAGHGKEEIRVQSPSGRTVPYNIDELTPLEYSVWYTPIESGQHKIFISYSGIELNGKWNFLKKIFLNFPFPFHT